MLLGHGYPLFCLLCHPVAFPQPFWPARPLTAAISFGPTSAAWVCLIANWGFSESTAQSRSVLKTGLGEKKLGGKFFVTWMWKLDSGKHQKKQDKTSLSPLSEQSPCLHIKHVEEKATREAFIWWRPVSLRNTTSLHALWYRDKAGRHLTEEQLGAYEISQAGYDEPDPEHRRNLLKWIITKMIPLQPREKSQGSGNPASMDTVSPSSGTDIFSWPTPLVQPGRVPKPAMATQAGLAPACHIWKQRKLSPSPFSSLSPTWTCTRKSPNKCERPWSSKPL